jgi:hypothetical protein
MSRPNLFVVGSMKCGTTILSEFLAQHPAVAVARGKETHYFTLHQTKGVDWYLAHFDADADVRYRVDASPTYLDLSLFSQTASLVKAFEPGAKIIVMIRDPLERALSHFRHLKAVNRIESLAARSFEDFVGEDWSDAIVAATGEAWLKFQVLHYSAYAEKIRQWVRQFGGENVLVINNEDLRSHGAAVMETVWSFLGLEPVAGDFTVQRYLGGTDVSAVPLPLRLRFYRTFGPDYFAANTMAGPVRPRPPAGVTFSNPLHAIVNDVAIGRDGWLFLAEGSNRTLDLFLDEGGATTRLAGAWRELIAGRASRLAGMGIRYLHAFVPEKLSVYPAEADLGLEPAQAPGARFFAMLSAEERRSVAFLHDYLRTQAASYPIFLKTDSHWSGVGAYAGYQMIMSALGLTMRPDLLGRPSRTGSSLLDLGRRLPTQPREEARFYDFRQEAEIVEEGDLVAYKKRNNVLNEPSLHVGSIIRFRNPAAPNPEAVLLFGDSFCEYRDHQLTGLLAETFRELTFAWSTSIDYGLLDEVKPDIVLTVHTERFMTRIPTDDFDLRGHARAILATRAAAIPAA